jgi:hypothetical protein
VTNVTLHFLYGGLLCVFLSLWNSYRSLVHRGKEPSPNICVYRQMCDGGVGGLRHLFNFEESFLSDREFFLQQSFAQRRVLLNRAFAQLLRMLSGLGYWQDWIVFAPCASRVHSFVTIVSENQTLHIYSISPIFAIVHLAAFRNHCP